MGILIPEELEGEAACLRMSYFRAKNAFNKCQAVRPGIEKILTMQREQLRVRGRDEMEGQGPGRLRIQQSS